MTSPDEAQAQLVALVADAVDPLRESAVAYTPEGVGIVAVAAVLGAPELVLAAMGGQFGHRNIGNRYGPDYEVWSFLYPLGVPADRDTEQEK